ncbi:HPr kinase/phosphorylase [Mycoplasma sp. NEAQ87857]|uniref:HPr(Ser) kinase/phosphatase n=1 Tax=Mycoplasma sp. NEAQ87857 TaxID=2683967 RepID=UPI001316320D|nr:HPr(Ser) kinase/phosphatase [Mycoplasma sp. NEAQ87857]QGZ97411.1 HPr kinase/phosphorylase [Mycoplasma sp. NEAQ87857]
MQKKISVEKVIKFFNLNIINKDCPNIKYDYIYLPAIKRLGLELAELFVTDRIYKNVISWGTSESLWFMQVGKQRSLKALRHVISQKPPLILLSRGVSKPALSWIYDVACEYGVPVALVNSSSSDISTNIGSYLNNFFADEIQIHGCLVLIGGTGVLIVGESGIGKSEAALELVQKGHILVSDDSVLIKNTSPVFIGRSPKITRNFLEVRGLGIIDIKYTYGTSAVTSSAPINLVIELVRKERQNELDRIGTEFLKFPLYNRFIRKIMVPIKEGGSASSLIEAAVSAYLSRHEGKDIIAEMEQRRKEEDEDE